MAAVADAIAQVIIAQSDMREIVIETETEIENVKEREIENE